MTSRNYIAIAGKLAALKSQAETIGLGLDYFVGLRDSADTIADVLQADNPRFDRVRFLAACGYATPEAI